MVDGDEIDLRLPVPGLTHEALVDSYKGAVKDLTERRLEEFAGPGHVASNGPRIRNHLALEARIELHVADLVDELSRDKAALLLVLLCQDQPAKLSRDPLLSDHQGGEGEEQ